MSPIEKHSRAQYSYGLISRQTPDGWWFSIVAVVSRFFRILGAILWQLVRWIWAAIRFLAPRVWSVLRRFAGWVIASPMRRTIALFVMMLVLLWAGYRIVRFAMIASDPRNDTFTSWWTSGPDEREVLVTERTACSGAPFVLPAEGYIGLLYGDPRGPYAETRRHQGIDIFSPGEPGVTPVYAAYDGYISRLEEWTSALIQRIPSDPLYPDRQIWLYYTHMAPATGETDYIEDAFPRGVREVFVKQGTLLGYTGNFSGYPGGVGVHLHFSIVLDNGSGSFTNELYFDNTVDPSRYLGMAVNYGCAPDVPACTLNPLCSEAYLGAGGG